MTSRRPPAIVINDSTPRDLEHLAPPNLSRHTRNEIAKQLEAAGVAEIELGIPGFTGTAIDDLAAVAMGLVRARPILWGPASKHTVETATRAGIGAITLSVKLSARRHGGVAVLNRLSHIIGHARERGLTVGLCGDDASRANFDLIRDVIAAAEASGATRFRFTDTAGLLHPIRTHALFRQLCAETDLELEFRGHDDFALATANTLAAVQGGATHVSTSLVKRSGRSAAAPLEDVVGAIRISTLHPVDIDLARVPPLAVQVAAILGVAPATTGQSRGPAGAMPRHDASRIGFGAVARPEAR
jgi:homocitrate synthase NifV